MKIFYRSVFRILLLFLLGCFCNSAQSQKNNDSANQHISTDSVRINTVKERLKKRFKDSLSYESDTVVALLLRKIEDITELINMANGISETGFDTAGISVNLPQTENLLFIIEKNYVSAKGYSQNLRSLKTTKGLLLQTNNQLGNWQNLLFEYSEKLADMKIKLSATIRDSILRKVPQDSLLQELYFGQLASLAVRWRQTDSVNNKNLLSIGLLQNRVASAFMKSKDLLDKTNEKINKYIQEIWRPEEPSLFKVSSNEYQNSFREVVAASFAATLNIVKYYLGMNTGTWILAALAILLLYLWFIVMLKKISKTNTLAETKHNAKLIAEKPLLVSVGLVLIFITFIFFNLPPAWTTLIWCTLAVGFYFLNATSINKAKTYRAEFLLIFLAINFLGILFKTSLAERWLQAVMDIVCIAYGIFIIRKINAGRQNFKWYSKNVYLVFAIFSFGALIANISGCFMLSKSLNNGAVYSVLAAHVLFTTTEIIVQLIYLQQEAFKENRFASYFDFYNIQQTLSKSLKTTAIIGWIIVMAQQLNVFDYAYDWTISFLTKERTLGNNIFDFGSILVFILVIWISSFVSKLLFVFFGHTKAENKTKKSRWGSYLILIRLGILSMGILIAFAASGIPMDKLTIIIGALGVGIGFGLQTIVNNLVSGVILAFEKPVQIGDAIEVGNKYGIVKEIGIRASKITTVEGSEVIVPNGDMLSQHIVNWTLSNHFRRVEIIVGVAYSTDLRTTEKILRDIISAQKGIESNPSPQVLAHQFGESAIDFRMLFWCDIDTWVNVKSEVLIKVHQAFSEHGVEIPFPQRDINIKDAEKLLNKEEIKKPEQSN